MLTIKKSLGQHFLIDETVSQRIVNTLKERNYSKLLEVGPGTGALTKYLVDIEDIDLKCIELDREKVAFLENKYPQLRGRIITEDILSAPRPFEGKFTVIGNFPYNISTQIVFKMLDWKDSVETMIGMFQKEVGQRFAAKEGSKVYGVTSVLIQAFFSVEYLFEVGEDAFNPPPKVKSAVIRLTPLAEPVKTWNPRAFTTLVKTAFMQRRKTLRNAVKSLFSPEKLKEDIFNKRAEQLSVQDFATLSFHMQDNNGKQQQQGE